MAEYSTLAAVDLGSNSFHCQLARVVDNQIYPLDSLREPVRLGSGLGEDKLLDDISQQRALAALARFGERLRGLDRRAVRAVATNALRVAKNARAFLKKAESVLGFRIEVIAGREEARLIYVGVAHGLTPSKEKRLVIDVGGGSTELIIGAGYKPEKLASLFMGCVSYSGRFFPDGKITKSAMQEAELAARGELQPVVADFSKRRWESAFGSSGTVRAIAEILQANGFDEGAITPAGLQRLRSSMVKAGSVERAGIVDVRADRASVLPGGIAILSAAMSELDIDTLQPAIGALREGVLYDLLGRVHRHDMRDVTVAQFMQRYHVDSTQARRVAKLACALYEQLEKADADGDVMTRSNVAWAAKLHEIGISVAYSGYHRHSAYIIENADMPGFARDEQLRLSALVLCHRRSLKKVPPAIADIVSWPAVLSLRLAALFYRKRSTLALPEAQLKHHAGNFRLTLDRDWLERNPLTATALREEIREWEKIGIELKIAGLGEAEVDAAAA